MSMNSHSFSGEPGSPNISFTWPSFLTSNNNKQPIDTLDKHIKNILIPRVSGTSGNVKVREYIMSSLASQGYSVELDQFTGTTPEEDVEFANIIANSNPGACRQLVLACHYDSKKLEGFLGASDSAVPCAMLLKMSETFKNSFRPAQEDSGQPGSDSDNKQGAIGLRFIFFDGEEAFVQWTPQDSIYGARHLAEKWEKQAVPKQCANMRLKNELARIELFVLLDLIGPADTTFVQYNQKLSHHYEALQKYEKEYLKSAGLTSSQIHREAAFRKRKLTLEFVEDDHVPFMRRGVPILSLLAYPFPKVWHKVEDDYWHIDFPRTRRILHVLEEFVSNYQGPSQAQVE